MTKKTNKPFYKKPSLSPLVLDALNWINENTSNVVNGCFHKENNRLKSFGVYNSLTKKHAIFYPENFYPEDFQEIKMVALTTKR